MTVISFPDSVRTDDLYRALRTIGLAVSANPDGWYVSNANEMRIGKPSVPVYLAKHIAASSECSEEGCHRTAAVFHDGVQLCSGHALEALQRAAYQR